MPTGDLDTVFNATPTSIRLAVDSVVAFARRNLGKRVVINFSGGGDSSSLLESAVHYADSNNILVVAAAGNQGHSGQVLYPAAYSLTHQNIIAVNGTDQWDNIPVYDAPGTAINLSAPGGGCPNCTGPSGNTQDSGGVMSPQGYVGSSQTDIWSTLPATGYGYMEGTSMAAPHVTGTAGLLLSVNPNLTPLQIRNILQCTADDKGSTGWDSYYGSGRLNAYRALLEVLRPNHASPANNATTACSPTLSWALRYGLSSSSKITSYRLQVDTTNGFGNPIRDISGITSTSNIVTCLKYATRYYWRVGAVIVDGSTSWSDTCYFNTQAPQLVSPGNCATVSSTPTLTWNAAGTPASYRLQVATNSSFSSPVKVDTTVVTDTTCAISGLSGTATYCWRVRPQYNCDSTHWSATWWFHTSPPPAPQLTGGYWKTEYLGELAWSPLLSWTTSGWCNITYGVYKYTCTRRHGCPDTIGTCIYSGTDTCYIDTTWICGPDTTTTAHYYVKETATQTGQSVLSNRVSYGQFDASKRGVVINDGESKMPDRVSLEGNYPEPFNPITMIKYSIPEPMAVKLVVYDVLGRNVRTLVDETQTAGNKTVRFDASSLPSGVYLYRLQAGSFSETRKLILLR